DLEPAHVGQLDVENDQVGLGIGQAQCLARRGGLADLEPCLAEDPGGEPPADFVVLNEEQGGGWAIGHGLNPRCESDMVSLRAGQERLSFSCGTVSSVSAGLLTRCGAAALHEYGKSRIILRGNVRNNRADEFSKRPWESAGAR